MTLTALPITSAGRFSPLGPRGILGHHTKRPLFTNSLLHPDRDSVEIILEKLDLRVHFTIRSAPVTQPASITIATRTDYSRTANAHLKIEHPNRARHDRAPQN
jgi:hypothetical protein